LAQQQLVPLGHMVTRVGNKWYINRSDGTSGLGQQLSVAEVIYAPLVNETEPPVALSNVRIRDEPLLVTSLRPLPAAPGGTAEPLYGTNNEGSKVSGVLYASRNLYLPFCVKCFCDGEL
jgi:hypothetical protein